jgi:hypothetical protein
METPADPMRKAHAAPRCHAKSKRSRKRCRGPAMRGKRVCRMHGAKAGAPDGTANGSYRHGRRTQAADASRLLIRELLKSSRSTLGLMGE